MRKNALPRRLGKGTGFTLLELLITVMLIGIIAAIAIPGLISAMQRAKQKRTMGDIRSLGTAVEEYVIDESFPPAGTGTVASVLGFPFFKPFYERVLPTMDSWGNDVHYDEVGAFAGYAGDSSYSIYSFGRNGTDDLASSLGEYDIRSFQFDIYFSDGHFTCAPGHK